MVLEKEIESYLKKRIESAGGLCWKFVSPGRRGVPDRWCVLGDYQFFVELKRPGHKRRADEKLQKAIAEQLRNRGLLVYVIASKEQVDRLIDEMRSGPVPPMESDFGRL